MKAHSPGLTPLQLAARLDRLAEADSRNPGGGDSHLLTWAAQGLRAADAAHASQFRRAERAQREVAQLRVRLADLQAQLVQARSDVVALEAICGRPAPHATEAHIECDKSGNVKTVRTYPITEGRRRAGFA